MLPGVSPIILILMLLVPHRFDLRVSIPYAKCADQCVNGGRMCSVLPRVSNTPMAWASWAGWPKAQEGPQQCLALLCTAPNGPQIQKYQREIAPLMH